MTETMARVSERYDCEILYHPGKANVVADALRRKSFGSLSILRRLSKPLQEEICRAEIEIVTERLATIEIVTARLVTMTLQSTLLERIKRGQLTYLYLIKQKGELESGKSTDFSMSVNGTLKYNNRICVPDDEELKKEILTEAHTTPYSLHPSTTQMYNDLKMHYLWPRMKKDVVELVAKCLTSQQVKREHYRPYGLLQPL